jgi:hypothetical protein
MAQEKNEKKKESGKVAQEVKTISGLPREYRLTWQTGGLQLLSVI